MVHPAGWEVLAVKDDEQVLTMLGGNKIIYAKVCLVHDSVDRKSLHEKFKSCVSKVAVIVSESSNSFVFNHLRWYAYSFVTGGQEKYRSYYYAYLGEYYVAVEFVTGNPQSVLLFVSEAKRLIKAIDYSALNRNNRLVVNGSVYSVSVPAEYNFSRASTDDSLVFLGETGYAVVNVAMDSGDSLEQYVSRYAALCDICVMDCIVEKAGAGADSGGEWFAYQVRCGGNIVGTCTYSRRFFGEDSIVLFLYEKGLSSLETHKLFSFEREVESDAQGQVLP